MLQKNKKMPPILKASLDYFYSIPSILAAKAVKDSLVEPYIPLTFEQEASIRFETGSQDDIGEYPEEIKTIAQKIATWLKIQIFSFISSFEPVDCYYKSIAEAEVGLLQVHGDTPGGPELICHDLAELSDRRTLEKITMACFDMIETQNDGTFIIDFSRFESYATRGKKVPLGCKVRFDEQKIHEIFYMGNVFYPNDHEWENIKTILRSSVFNITTFYHSYWFHGNLGSKLFIASHRLLKTGHPLQRLMFPYVRNMHKNMTRARFSVFGKSGVLKTASQITTTDCIEIGKYCRAAYDVVLPEEYNCLYGLIGQQVLQIWDVLYKHVDQYLQLYAADMQQITEWMDYVATNCHPRYKELSLSNSVTHMIFSLSIRHHLQGHVMYGDSNPRNIGTCMIKDADGNYTEEKRNTNLRNGVIISINRVGPKFTDDFSDLGANAEAVQILKSLHLELNELAKQIRWLRDVASSPWS